jgi:hypothetical protein
VLEELEEEPEMVPKPMPEDVPEEAPVEGAMIITHVAGPSPTHGAVEASSLAPHVADIMDAAAGVAVETEVMMGHPTFYAPDDIPLDESTSVAPRALS